GTGGVDRIVTGNGNDVVHGGAAGDNIDAGNGLNVVFGDGGDYTPGLAVNTNFGTGGVDDITTGGGNDIVIGGAGGDRIRTGGGSDAVYGDNGRETGSLSRTTGVGSGGDDTIDSGPGDDRVFGGAGGDTIDTGEGNDKVFGDYGQVTAGESVTTDFGSGGNDIVSAGGGDDQVFGGGGNDVLGGEGGNDVVFGDNGRIGGGRMTTIEPLIGGNDRIMGGEGDDFLFGGIGSDVINGDGGNDKILGDNGYADGVYITTEFSTVGGNDDINGGAGNDIAFGGFGDDRLDGDSGNDVLLGDNGYAVCPGGVPREVSTTDPAIGGNDFIIGGPGNDVLIGGWGNDVFVGNLSEDIIIGDNGQVFFDEFGNVILVVSFGNSALDRDAQYGLYAFGIDKSGLLAFNLAGGVLSPNPGLPMFGGGDGIGGGAIVFVHHHGKPEVREFECTSNDSQTGEPGKGIATGQIAPVPFEECAWNKELPKPAGETGSAQRDDRKTEVEPGVPGAVEIAAAGMAAFGWKVAQNRTGAGRGAEGIRIRLSDQQRIRNANVLDLRERGRLVYDSATGQFVPGRRGKGDRRLH
ncbi:MAG: calcium-binding protein, partial [Proteobacteria bacterium]